MKRLIFVCSGNTCRSPLAEGIAKKIFPEILLRDIEISSAGTSAPAGFPASALAVDVSRRNAIDLSGHRSRPVDANMIREADLIIALTERHKRIIETIEPRSAEYTFLLGDFCGGAAGDIGDPIGEGLEAYERTFAVIYRCVEGLKDRLARFDGWKR
ncbi:MAG: low molecular weight protein arginine phosphatase [Chitinivibrionia bacterium]|nr:low molecular weight protein arginine phosphatase [Chitinivibrionia bacterium]